MKEKVGVLVMSANMHAMTRFLRRLSSLDSDPKANPFQDAMVSFKDWSLQDGDSECIRRLWSKGVTISSSLQEAFGISDIIYIPIIMMLTSFYLENLSKN